MHNKWIKVLTLTLSMYAYPSFALSVQCNYHIRHDILQWPTVDRTAYPFRRPIK